MTQSTSCNTSQGPPKKRPKLPDTEDAIINIHIPVIDSSLSDSLDSMVSNYYIFQAVHLPKYPTTKTTKTSLFSWKDVQSLYQNLSEEDSKSWCIETAGASNVPDATEFLNATTTTTTNADSPSMKAYCSFTIQKDTKSLNTMLSSLPVSIIHKQWTHNPCVWLFFGRNFSNNDDDVTDLQGRPEHTDSIRHDGTWHFQLSGIKRWLLRPTPKLLEHLKETMSQKDYQKWEENASHHVTVDCHAGDVLLVNTRLWFHQTLIPPQPEPSVSYARDFWTQERAEDGQMTNLDGLYATEDIEPGTILFKESDMPDCELHRSKDAYNCEVVELDDGTMAVVSIQTIAAGDFFCLEESEDEEEDDEEDEEDDDDDGFVCIPVPK